MHARWLVLLAACGGRGGPATPRERPAVQLVRCAPATPPPIATDTAERVTRRGFGGGGNFGRAIPGRRPSLSFGTVSSNAVISGDEVLPTLRAKQAELLACFTDVRSLARIAVVYRLVINGDGTVSSPELTSSALAGTIDACIKRSFRAMKFPAKGAPSAVSIPLVWDSTGTFALPTQEAPAIDPGPWTPFAIDGRAPGPAVSGAARATEAVLRTKLPGIDKCFLRPTPTGSLRIHLELDVSGELSSVRAGGLGDKESEWCAAKALAGLKVMTPSQEHVEIACDLSRGDAAPWRVSPTAGYQVIEADAKGLRHGAQTIVPGVSEPEPLPAETYVVIARPETLGGMLQLALMWARDATALLIAVGDGKTPPVFLGMGNTSPSEEDGEAVRPAIRVGRLATSGCIGRTTHKADPSKAGELAGLMQKLADRCKTLTCAPTMVVAIDSDATTRDLLEVAGAARRAGFERLLFGGAELGCTPELKKKGDLDIDIAPDFE